MGEGGSGRVGLVGVRVDVNDELKLLWKCKKSGGVVRSDRAWGVEWWGLVDRELVGW